MIGFFSSWAKQIVFAVIISTIIELILPDSKNKKYVKMVLGIYILFCIISPAINKKNMLSLENIDLEQYETTNSGQQTKTLNQSSMDERLQELYVQELQNNIKTKVEESGYDVHSCKVDAVLTGEEENQGINKISLVVSKKSADNKQKNNSNVKSVERVEIKIGLDKFLKDNEEDKTCTNSAEDLIKEISNYYNVSQDKIYIKINK